jgi:hypothetical protein
MERLARCSAAFAIMTGEANLVMLRVKWNIQGYNHDGLTLATKRIQASDVLGSQNRSLTCVN